MSNIVQDAFQALASYDPDRISAVFAEDAEWVSPPGNAVAVALGAPHHMVGRSSIVRFFSEDFPRLFVRDVDVVFRGVYGEGEWVIVEAILSGTLGNGNRYVNDYCFVFQVRGGVVCRVREYVDTARGHRMIFGDGS